jgi:hypothetical protein
MGEWSGSGAGEIDECVGRGATGRHPAGVAGMRSPRGGRGLPRSGACARERAGEGEEGGRARPGRGRARASKRLLARAREELGRAGLHERARSEVSAHQVRN